jgi:hypothetical protein
LREHVQLPYPSSEPVSQCPFDLVHSDVWGAAPFVSKDGYKYYIIFIYDFSQHTYIIFIYDLYIFYPSIRISLL